MKTENEIKAMTPEEHLDEAAGLMATRTDMPERMWAAAQTHLLMATVKLGLDGQRYQEAHETTIWQYVGEVGYGWRCSCGEGNTEAHLSEDGAVRFARFHRLEMNQGRA